MDGVSDDGVHAALAGRNREVTRDKGLADALMQQVRRSAQTLRPLLVLTDGWAAYPTAFAAPFARRSKSWQESVEPL